MLTECGHVTYPDALSRLGSMTTECHKCGRVVHIIRKASRKELIAQQLGLTLEDLQEPGINDPPPL